MHPQVYFRMQTRGFAMLAPMVRPNARQPELLRGCLEACAAALRDCPTSQVTVPSFTPSHPP